MSFFIDESLLHFLGRVQDTSLRKFLDMAWQNHKFKLLSVIICQPVCQSMDDKEKMRVPSLFRTVRDYELFFIIFVLWLNDNLKFDCY